jgi:DNA primase
MDFKEQVKQAADIVQVIGEVVRLKPAGPGRYKGLCPFHTEKTPSFNVDRTKQFFYCFGCQKGGDVFKFVCEIDAVTFFEALTSLAERFGIPVPKRNPYSDEESRQRDALLSIQDAALRFFIGSMNAETRRYLAGRHVKAASIEEFGLGYAPPGGVLVRRLLADGFSKDHVAASGLAVQRDDGTLGDRFRHRLIFPIHNEAGKAIAFGARALDGEEPKYLNSSDTRLYTKKKVLYNLHRAKETIRRQDHTILVEGYMDVIGVSQAGVKNVVASCGTALSEDHVRMLRRHSDRIVLNFDPDRAGAQATESRIQMLLEESMRVRVLTLEEELDPDEYIARHGVEAYQARAAAADGVFHWLADRARARFDMRTAEGRMEGFRTLLKPVLERIPDRLERLAVVNDVAAYLGVDARAILDQLKATGRRTAPGSSGSGASSGLPPAEHLLLRGLLEHPEAARALAGRLSEIETSRLVRTAVQLAAAGQLTYAELEVRLAPDERQLLARAVFGDKQDEVPVEQLYACADSLAQSQAARARGQLRQRIKELEREGRMQEAMDLMRQVGSPSARLGVEGDSELT